MTTIAVGKTRFSGFSPGHNGTKREVLLKMLLPRKVVNSHVSAEDVSGGQPSDFCKMLSPQVN